MFAAAADTMIHPVQIAHINLASGGAALTRLRIRVMSIGRCLHKLTLSLADIK